MASRATPAPAAKRLHECRVERLNRGLSTRAAAKEMGVSYRVLQRFERGYGVHVANLKLIADFYGCKVTDLIEPLEPAA